MQESDELVTTGSFTFALLYHRLTGYRVHVHAYSSWGHSMDREEYVRTDHTSSDAYNIVTEEVGMFLAALKDDLDHRVLT